MTRQIKILYAITLLLLLTGLAKSARADGVTSARVDITVSVTLQETACHINGDVTTPTVEFGDVNTALIDGKTYRAQKLPVKITCDSDIPDTLSYELRGDVAEFDSEALATDIQGVGLKVFNEDGTALAINTLVDVKNSPSLDLMVVPVKDTDVTLSGGEFNAVATLILQQK